MPTVQELMQVAKSVQTGRLDRILQRLGTLEDGLRQHGFDELVERLCLGRQALLSGVETELQRSLAHITSKLGHLQKRN